MYQYFIKKNGNKQQEIINFKTFEEAKNYALNNKEITPETHSLYKYY